MDSNQGVLFVFKKFVNCHYDLVIIKASVTRLGYFWKIFDTNFLTNIFGDCRGYFEQCHFLSKNCSCFFEKLGYFLFQHLVKTDWSTNSNWRHPKYLFSGLSWWTDWADLLGGWRPTKSYSLTRSHRGWKQDLHPAFEICRGRGRNVSLLPFISSWLLSIYKSAP